MLIVPKRKRRRPVAEASAPQVVIVALAIEVAALRDLSGWEPVGTLLDDLLDSMRGEGGLTMREARRLRTWAHNWRAICAEVREFYQTHHHEREVQPGIWYVLGTGQRPTGPSLGRLRDAYTDAHGYPPSLDLLPRPATPETTP